ncbi:hypothetical protein [Phenylobacterium deserti]|uniref:Uncharacterized protein n=1 Tax=Phenylobacterium deserti TaxID=1914756 RepID=A0A328ACA6_9CAUL|nr:hypothetical protein [Phenylobacterium deserti]RAK52280.1 hypothetical protein DJ018_14155 [Phenylobacterium deserti]
MDLSDRRIRIALGGAAVAVLAGGLVAIGMIAPHKDEAPPPPPASRAGLIIEEGQPDQGVDASKALRCFVAGQFVGEMSLARCAQRNGVATAALDVGVDASGALAAAGQAGTVLTPLPPSEQAPTPLQPTPVQPAGPPAGACWRYADSQWRRLPGEMTLNACVQTLYAGRCEKAGAASYGRWMQQTLRLVPGKVEISSDNQSFRTLAEQAAGCSLPVLQGS